MALRGLNGHGTRGGLAGRVLALEQVFGATRGTDPAQARLEALWLALPLPVRTYLNQYDVQDSDSRSSHLELLVAQAIHGVMRDEDALSIVAGWVLRQAWGMLSEWHAYDLRARGVREWTCDNAHTRDLAARELFDVSGRELHRLWTGDPAGVEWVRLWVKFVCIHVHSDVLERAGLGDAELELLRSATESPTSA